MFRCPTSAETCRRPTELVRIWRSTLVCFVRSDRVESVSRSSFVSTRTRTNQVDFRFTFRFSLSCVWFEQSHFSCSICCFMKELAVCISPINLLIFWWKSTISSCWLVCTDRQKSLSAANWETSFRRSCRSLSNRLRREQFDGSPISADGSTFSSEHLMNPSSSSWETFLLLCSSLLRPVESSVERSRSKNKQIDSIDEKRNELWLVWHCSCCSIWQSWFESRSVDEHDEPERTTVERPLLVEPSLGLLKHLSEELSASTKSMIFFRRDKSIDELKTKISFGLLLNSASC